jgi:rhodanese-related sulfurtransferase
MAGSRFGIATVVREAAIPLDLQLLRESETVSRMIRQISRDELKAKIDRGDPFDLVETLSAEHFEHAHLPGAVNIPLDKVAELAPVRLPDKQREVVLYCANVKCHAAENAGHQLAALGYANVRYFPGGKHEWITTGLPIERGMAVMRT